MTFIRIELTDWEAVFYIAKWLVIGVAIGAIIRLIIHSIRERKKK